MSWLRIDDGFIDHPKLLSLGPPADRWTFLELLTYCARHHTEGYFPTTIRSQNARVTRSFIAKCIDVGLIDKTPSGELRIHDWERYNPSKDATGAARQQRWRNAHRNAGVTEKVTDDVTPSRARDPVPSLKDDTPLGVESSLTTPQTEASYADDSPGLNGRSPSDTPQPIKLSADALRVPPDYPEDEDLDPWRVKPYE
jgi:hypothetical protein